MFALIWHNSTLDELANIYVATDSLERQRIAEGVEAMNRRLAVDPLDEGESRFAGFRITFPFLLAVTFHVDEVNQIVRVSRVIRYGKS